MALIEIKQNLSVPGLVLSRQVYIYIFSGELLYLNNFDYFETFGQFHTFTQGAFVFLFPPFLISQSCFLVPYIILVCFLLMYVHHPHFRERPSEVDFIQQKQNKHNNFIALFQLPSTASSICVVSLEISI